METEQRAIQTEFDMIHVEEIPSHRPSRDTQSQTETHTQTHTDTHRHTQTHTDTHRQTHKVTEIENHEARSRDRLAEG